MNSCFIFKVFILLFHMRDFSSSLDMIFLAGEAWFHILDLNTQLYIYIYRLKLRYNDDILFFRAYAFKVETERLVNDLKKSSEDAEDKLVSILERSESLAKSSEEIHDSLSSIDVQTQQLAQASKSVEDHIEAVLNHSEAIFEQSQGIAATQSELQKGQTLMKDRLNEGMVKIHDSHNMLGQTIEKLKSGTVEIEKEIIKVRDGMFLKMENLQGKADDIGNIAGISLEKQKELLVGQSTAIEGLQFLTKSHSEALEESRSSIKKLVEYSSSQQEELLARQAKLHQVHDHLIENSKFILAAQVLT